MQNVKDLDLLREYREVWHSHRTAVRVKRTISNDRFRNTHNQGKKNRAQKKFDKTLKALRLCEQRLFDYLFASNIIACKHAETKTEIINNQIHIARGKFHEFDNSHGHCVIDIRSGEIIYNRLIDEKRLAEPLIIISNYEQSCP